MTRSPRLRWALHGLLLGSLALGSAGCPVDSRELEETDGHGGRRATGGAGSAGAGAQNRGGSGGDAGQITFTGGEDGYGGDTGAGAPGSGGTLQSGGASGDAGSPTEGGVAGGGGPIDGCSDLDGNHVADCSETLAKNPSFEENGDSWKAEPDVVVAWKSKQAGQSGLLSVKNTRIADLTGLSLGSGLQCVRAQPNYSYTVYARVFIPDKQGAGQGGAGLLFYDSVDCSGNPTYGFTTTLFSEIGTWLTTDGFGQAPETTRSMAIRLVAVKPFAQNSFDVWFDDVLVRRY